MTTLEKIHRKADELDSGTLILHRLIQTAREEGLSLRAIAEAANLSHEQVRRIAGT